ncbi:hypothetical protein [Amycolatopsis sp. cmx-11-12]|uniref:hypothetical protein n=1 Tax=Amycolatopsis sp. cmx-11-12 TaxID=2785795 RepID=UPI0039185F6A
MEIFSAAAHSFGKTFLRLDVHGPVLGPATVFLQNLIVSSIVLTLPETLVIDLRHTTSLDLAGVNTLLTGYNTAIDHGTSYRVLHACGPVRDLLQLTRTWEVLADSDDLGALLGAVLLIPDAGPSS